MKLKSESEVAQSFPTLHDPMDYSLPESVHGIFQAKVLEWGAIAVYKLQDLKEFCRLVFSSMHSKPHPSSIIHLIPTPGAIEHIYTSIQPLFYTSVSLLLSCIQGYRYHLSKFHIYALVYCIGVFLSGLLHSVCPVVGFLGHKAVLFPVF